MTTLMEIDPDATVVKLDIEGVEFQILPRVIEMMSKTSTWIIEAHARAGSAQDLAAEFSKRGFFVYYLEKKSNIVIPFNSESLIDGTTTIFCVR